MFTKRHIKSLLDGMWLSITFMFFSMRWRVSIVIVGRKLHFNSWVKESLIGHIFFYFGWSYFQDALCLQCSVVRWFLVTIEKIGKYKVICWFVGKRKHYWTPFSIVFSLLLLLLFYYYYSYYSYYYDEI